MTPNPNARYAAEHETGQVQIVVEPERAAVFVNGHYAGHVEAFDGRKGLRVSEGTHEFRVALPGYQPFETELTVRAGQHYRLETKLIPDGKSVLREQEQEEAE